MEEFLKLIGLGVPFYLGAGTYAVFSWLDSNASGEATQVISSWLHGRSHNKPDLGNLIIRAFDRIYGSPLLSFRAFRRSAAVSSTIWFIITFLPEAFTFNNSYLIVPWILVIGANLACVVISDYCSLFFVRLFLRVAQAHPFIASFTSSLIGAFVVMSYFMVWSLLAIIPSLGLPNEEIWGMAMLDRDLWGFVLSSLRLALHTSTTSEIASIFFPRMTPALVIHLWLPLFALSSLFVRLIFWIFRAVERAQWFLKEGSAHPLKAIGIVATIIVFGSAMLVKEGWALLGVLERN